ncbi:helix-turn-helix domain-containing protein [Oceanobacillus locisalsi]|uniref:Helix-turn-helix domain-containing protein n=1 Tax=Oceanobacillus locisalsi TaxID=546107 RepID=A0ABW3NKE9_9BACI
MNTGQRIIQLRSQKNWSQKVLAKQVKINVSVMNRIEAGERPIKGDELIVIADTLGVTTDYLLGKEAPVSKMPKQKPENTYIKSIQRNFPDANAMFQDMASLSSEQMQDVYDYLLFKKSRKRNMK